MSNEKIIVVKARERNTWSGFIRFNNCKDYLSPYFDKTGTIVTGLEEEDEVKLGKKLGKDLSKGSDFWIDYKIIFTNKDKHFNLTNPEHELAYKFMLAHKRIANSIEELNKGLWPQSDYIIVDETKEAEIKNKEYTLRRRANVAFGKLSLDQMTSILKLYPNFINMSSASADVIEAKLYEELEKDPKKFLALVEDKKLDTKVFVKELVSAGVLRKNRAAYYYGEDCIGHDLEATVSYIENPENQGLLIALKEELDKNK